MKLIGILIALIALVGGGWLLSTQEQESKPIDTSARFNESSGDINEARVEVYDGISIAKSTRILILSGRGLSGSLKAEVRNLTELEQLDLSNNDFTGLPAEVGQLSKLRILNLSNNPFTGLPYELGNLKNLEVLDLRGTQYANQDLEVIKEGLSPDVTILKD